MRENRFTESRWELIKKNYSFAICSATFLDDWCVLLSFTVLFPSMFFAFVTQDMWDIDGFNWMSTVSLVGLLSTPVILFVLWCVQCVWRYFDNPYGS